MGGSAGAGGALVDGSDDVPARDAPTFDARADANFAIDDASAGCNDVVNVAPVIAGQIVAANLPTPMGGTMVDGTYFETAYTIYAGPGGATGPEGVDHQLTAILAGRTARVAVLANGVQKRYVFNIATSGTQTTWTPSCPPNQGPIPYGFDASAAQIVLYLTNDPTSLRTFTLTRQ